MLKSVHLQPCSWEIYAAILVAISLVSCGNPSPSEVTMPKTTATTRAEDTATATVTKSATSTARVVTPTSTPQNPVPMPVNIIPRPVSEVIKRGTFVLTAQAGIIVEPATDEVKAIGQYLADAINPATGYGINVQGTEIAPGKGNITLTLAGSDPVLGDEGYKLTITPELVRLVANQPAGLFYGVQTIRQLLPPAINSASLQPGPWILGTGTITDFPRFTWRGAMLDVARHFFSVKDVIRYIDLLAYYKFNRLHLHLSDDQGWRIQIKSWPNLAIHGGSLEVGGGPGGYYSQEDYAYIVNFARSRYITIIPEIDMPGHTTAALASYPELTCDGIAPQLYTGINVGFSSICINKEITYTFLENVIGELAAMTPGAYIHIGGDEAKATSQPDYINFVKRIQSIAAANGKQVVGWEEIAQAPLLPGSIVQHWNLNAGLTVQAIQQGAKVIMSPADRAYLDMKYTATTSFGLEWAGTINLEKGYSWDPATLISGVTEKDIPGVEAPLWSETLNSMEEIEYMAFPRLPGYAEIGWTPQSRRDWSEYKSRLATHGPRLEALGVNFYRSPEIAWP